MLTLRDQLVSFYEGRRGETETASASDTGK
jgi:hypothetical protein